jgi:hypothetical protein
MLNRWMARFFRAKGDRSPADDQRLAISNLIEIPCLREELEAVQKLSGWNGFGCNSKQQVWPKNKRGFVRPEQRTFLQQKCDIPDQVVRALLNAHPTGRDFYIRPEGAFLLSSGERFVLFRPKSR